MSHYVLNISFTDEALNVIYKAGEKLALIKGVTGDTGSAVVWVSTAPFEKNKIEWETDILLYSSRQEAQNGAEISKLSEQDAIDNVLYSFEGATFQNAVTSPSVGANEYGVVNKMKEYSYLTFGLAQAVAVNGEKSDGNPINAITLPYNHTAVMSPIERVKIFLARDIDDGVVITREFSNFLEVEYRGSETEKNVKYDFNNGMFIPA